jgi:fructose-1,6-bisphosphatase/sedoheptulose 1,7-bisphosphatase-like protein
MRVQKVVRVVLVLAVSGSLVGCESKAGTGAIIGGAGGAAAGGLIGSLSHARAGEGALIGGAIGALGGALIGHGMDKDDEKREKERREYETYRERSYYRQVQPAASYGAARPVSKEDVIAWSAKGTREDIIVDRIEQSGSKFHLTAADENQLRDAGVSPEVIRRMKESSRY